MTTGRRSLAFLVLCGCLPSPTVEAPAALSQPAAIRAETDGLAARFGVATARFDADGVWLDGAGSLSLAVTDWGRDERVSVGGLAPTLVTVDGVARAEYAHPGLTEWWQVEGSQLHHGFEVDEAPAGDGPLTLSVAVDGEVALAGDAAVITDAAGGVWTYAELWAWDDTGRELDARIDVVDGAIQLVVDDTDAVYPLHIDPVVTTASATFLGESAGDEAGTAVASLGDVNGDGYDDLGVGAPSHLGTAGRVYVYLGSATGIGATAAMVIDGAAAGDELGASVAGAGDIDHDGYDDVVIGAPGAGGGVGQLEVYYGGPTGLDTASPTTLAGGSAERMGAAVSGAGDVNGDGYDDVVVGAPDYNFARGRVLVLVGSAAGLDVTTPFATLGGSGANARLGAAVSGGGDVNNDGYDDLVLGSPGYSSGAGRAYVYLGASATVATPANLILTGDPSDATGTAVAIVGDTDADGYADIAVGSPGASAGNGTVGVYRGGATGVTATAAVLLHDDAAGGDFGAALSGGDVHGDGYADLLVGAPDHDVSTGRVYVYVGGPGSITDGAQTTLDGPSSGSLFGAGLAGGLDVDANGADDVGVGAPTAFTTGATYVYTSTVDADGDGYDVSTDCDDTDAAIYPGATEDPGDQVDQDCDGGEVCFVDNDSDGYRPSTFGTVVSTDTDCTDAGEATASSSPGDCDDTSASVNPGASEMAANGVDDNCDGFESCYIDADGDGQRPNRSTTRSADLDCSDAGEADGTASLGDCNDADATVFAGAVEVVGDGLDQDCDGGDTCYADLDDDGYRTDSLVASDDLDCDDTAEATPADPAGDCADGNAATHPGADEITGDNIDGNCDGAEVCFIDADGDDYRPDDVTTVFSTDTDCNDVGEATAMDASGDCDDGERSTHPDAAEIPGDQLDEDCDGVEVCYVDADGDGARASGFTVVTSTDLDCTDAGEALLTAVADCNDADPTIHVGATDTPSDGIDQDCDGWDDCYVDFDNDGYRTDTVRENTDGDCDDPGEASASDPTGDCNDRNASFNPGAADTPGDGLDQNCDGLESCFADADGDGHRPDAVSTVASADADCSDAGEATSRMPTDDCNDADPTVNGGARELPGDGIDEDCDGVELCLPDTDGDGYRPDSSYTLASADMDCNDAGEATEATPAGDCDDADGARNPGAVEVVADEVDQNCDGSEICYADVDVDGYRPDDKSTVSSVDRDCRDAGEATAADPAGDCDDNARGYHPGAPEDDCTDPNDYNCDGSTGYADADGDGTAACEDCNDADGAVNPAAAEQCNGYDDNCDGRIDGPQSADAQTWYADLDQDGYTSETDMVVSCTAPEGYTNASESWDCNDNRDVVHPGAVDHPNDGVDQDCDGLIDNAPGDTGEVDDGKTTGCGCATETSGGTGVAAAVALAALTLGRRRERR